jgi:hypothetical protein
MLERAKLSDALQRVKHVSDPTDGRAAQPARSPHALLLALH